MTGTNDDRIMTLHPQGKQGVNIMRDKYEAVRNCLLEAVPNDQTGVALSSIAGSIAPKLPQDLFPGGEKVTWYVMAVKQDLEARGLIEQTPHVKPQHLRRTGTVS